MTVHHNANIDRFTGFADCYDRHRPQPPEIITAILTQLLGDPAPSLVVDLGSGTGLSTRIWIGRAREVIGVEPNADMRRVAEANTPRASGIRYTDGHSTHTGLPDGAADCVCCSQAFHWMEPEPTIAEVHRILRPGGIFAIIDCDWPPTIHCEAEQAYQSLSTRVAALIRQLQSADAAHQWPKDRHLARLRESACFRHVKEIAVHHVETGNADRFIGLALSQGSLQTLLKQGLSEDAIGLTDFRAKVVSLLGETPRPWYFSYRVRMGVK